MPDGFRAGDHLRFLNGDALKIRIWPILTIGFSALIALVALSGWLVFVRAAGAYSEISQIYQAEHDTEHALTAVRSDIALSAILVRDFLLDPQFPSQNAISEMNRLRTHVEQELERLQPLLPGQESANLARLRTQTEVYWTTVDPVLQAQAADRGRLGFSFIQTEIVPRRQAALRVLSQVEQLSSDAFAQRKADIDAKNAGLAFYVGRMVGITLLIAFAVAGVTIWRMYALERSADYQHRKVQAAEEGLRRLSQQLVGTQEDERRSLSRDLHDQVGQVLTALSMSVGNLLMLADRSDSRVAQELDLAKRLVTQALRSTRDIAMGLRPTMLDDLGLEAALEWYARQHSKIYETPVSLNISASLAQLSDQQRTCVYRIVQEALNNVAKHAGASNISVDVSTPGRDLRVDITDDGRGFNVWNGHSRRGLGLMGMRERVTQLGGELVIDSGSGNGTRISVILPLNHSAA